MGITVVNNTVQVQVQQILQILQKFNSQIPIQVYPSILKKLGNSYKH
jgi:hypothetical protein